MPSFFASPVPGQVRYIERDAAFKAFITQCPFQFSTFPQHKTHRIALWHAQLRLSFCFFLIFCAFGLETPHCGAALLTRLSPQKDKPSETKLLIKIRRAKGGVGGETDGRRSKCEAAAACLIMCHAYRAARTVIIIALLLLLLFWFHCYSRFYSLMFLGGPQSDLGDTFADLLRSANSLANCVLHTHIHWTVNCFFITYHPL